MKVPIYKLEFDDDFIDRFQDCAANILRSDHMAEGPFVREWERKFAEFIGVQHAIAVTNGTTALDIALRAIDVRDKDVIVPTNTFAATALAVQNAGGNPVLVDMERDTFGIDPEALADTLFGDKHHDIAAVVMVHIGGLVSQYTEDIVGICQEYGVPLIEDAAHAHGSSYGHYKAGRIGDIACFSFFPTKVSTTGEGGMIVTQNGVLHDTMRSLKDLGRLLSNPVFHVNEGVNAKVTEFTGLMGYLDMDRIATRISKRATIAALYAKELAGMGAYEVMVPDPDVARSSFYKCIVRTPTICNDDLKYYCKNRGVSLTGEVYRYPLHQQPLWKREWQASKFPVADKFAAHHICPPCYPELTIAEVEYVCDVLKQAAKELQ